MFEDTCYCYLASDMNKQAEELADECIAREDFDDLRKANFWCIKGDIHNSVEFYETAWELSNKRHARSMRSLGALFVHLKRYDEAAAALKNALDLNHLQPGTWFAHGCASLVCGDYSGAAKSFRRCVTLGIPILNFQLKMSRIRQFRGVGESGQRGAQSRKQTRCAQKLGRSDQM